MGNKSIHSTAEVSERAIIGKNTLIWNYSQVREEAVLGSDCIVGKNVYIDFGVKVGSKVKIQNNASIFHGAIIESGVFIGPHVCITNDKWPRAINQQGILKGADDWSVSGVTIKKGASIGASSVICPGITIGSFAMVGAGSVVTKDVPERALVVGNPAVIVGYICACCDKKIEDSPHTDCCPRCRKEKR
jgi:UDP-2-acetamido-3-amino-2,3-dideoxy-glucuronate N-acetyltransferase